MYKKDMHLFCAIFLKVVFFKIVFHVFKVGRSFFILKSKSDINSFCINISNLKRLSFLSKTFIELLIKVFSAKFISLSVSFPSNLRCWSTLFN